MIEYAYGNPHFWNSMMYIFTYKLLKKEVF